MEIRRERELLDKEQSELTALLGSPARQRTRLKRDFAKIRARYGPETALGARRTTVEEAAPARDIPLEAMIEREPVTVILSRRGWIRAMKGHVELVAADTLKFKEGDGPRFRLSCTDDRQVAARGRGRKILYASGLTNCPADGGFGEPVRAMIDLDGETNVVALFPAARQGAIVAGGVGRTRISCPDQRRYR